MPKEAQIVVDLVPPSDLPPGIDAEFTVQSEPKRIEAVLRCSTPGVARDTFNRMLQAVCIAQQASSPQ